MLVSQTILHQNDDVRLSFMIIVMKIIVYYYFVNIVIVGLFI